MIELAHSERMRGAQRNARKTMGEMDCLTLSPTRLTMPPVPANNGFGTDMVSMGLAVHGGVDAQIRVNQWAARAGRRGTLMADGFPLCLKEPT